VKIIKLILFLACTILASFYVQEQAITQNTFGKGLIKVTAKIAPTACFLPLDLNHYSLINEGLKNRESAILIRRARLKFNGFAFTSKLKYKIEPGML